MFFLTPEQRAEIAAQHRAHAQKVREITALSHRELADYLVTNVRNCWELKRFRLGEPIYEATLVYVLIPEVLKRLRSLEESVQPRCTTCAECIANA